jgi:hypothetical protein
VGVADDDVRLRERAVLEKLLEKMQVPSAPSGSFEEVAHQLDQPYLFVDLRSAPPRHWLRGEFVSVSLGCAINTAPWSRVLDAFFFIDKAEPNRYCRKVINKQHCFRKITAWK